MEKPFKCDYCDKAFASELSRWQHSLKKHPRCSNTKPKLAPKQMLSTGTGKNSEAIATEEKSC
jgi:hypothetical protein